MSQDLENVLSHLSVLVTPADLPADKQLVLVIDALHLPLVMADRERSRSPSVESGRELEADTTSSLGSSKVTLSTNLDRAITQASEKDLETGVDEKGITYEYLTFDTVLPDLFHNPSHASTKGAPNLKRFDSPFEWSLSRKNICLSLSCVATFLAASSAGAYSIASEPLSEKWSLGTVAFNTGVTTWAMGFASSPMFLAPLSEINGRRPVFLFSGFMFFVALIGCAVTDSFAGMLVARFFVGAGASTFATMVGGVVSDVYHAQDRNTPMALYSGSALAGTGFGPLIYGFVVTRVSWRWVFWVHVIALGLTLVGLVFLFKETRGSVLLSRKAKALNKYLDQLASDKSGDNDRVPGSNLRYKVEADEQRASLATLLYFSLTTPFKLLATEPVVFFFSLWAAFAWGILYMQFNVIPLIYSTNHGFDTEQVGAIFSAIIVGTIVATTLSIYQEKLGRVRWPKLTSTPEGRLYFACLEAVLLPIGLFWFGWTTSSSVHWIVPTIGLAVAQIGIFSIYLAVFNYLADVYHRYASSALASQSFCRNTLAAVFPLFSQAMFRRLGFPGASSLLGGLSAILTIVPWVLVWKGEKIRARSKVASEIVHHHG